MPGFFDQPVNQYAPNPEPPETTLMRDLLTRKAIGLQSDPYGGNVMRNNFLNPAPAFMGSGGGPSSEFFYGSGGSGGSGGGANPGAIAPRQSPIRALMQRLTQTVGPRSVGPGPGLHRSQLASLLRSATPGPDKNLGSFFRAMQRFAPPRDSRSALRSLLAMAQGLQAQHDGIGMDDTGQLPGFDGMCR